MRCRFKLNYLPLFFTVSLNAFGDAASPVPHYRIGETARVEVVATIGVTAVDPEKTEVLKRERAPRVPVIYRWNTNAVDEAVTGLRDSFATNRQNFLVAVQRAFNKSVLDERGLTNQRYQRMVSSFQSANRWFPFSTNLANAWAQGASDEDQIIPFEDRLRGLMAGRYIRPDEHPAAAKIGYQVKLVPTDAASPLTPIQVQQTRSVARSNVVALGKVRTEYRRELSPEPRAVGRFVSLFVRPTCIADAVLTAEMREKEIGTLSSVVQYAPGDVIVRRGEVVTAATKAALDEFRGKLALLRGPTANAARVPLSILPWLLGGGAAGWSKADQSSAVPVG